MCLVAIVGGAVLVELGALLWAAPTVLRASGAPALAMACDRLVGPLLPLGTLGGGVGLTVAAAVPMLGWQGNRRSRAQIATLTIEPGLGRHEHRDGFVLVVLPTGRPMAYSLGPPKPQVIVSEGLRDTLSDAQLDAVIAHEAAHLTHHHPRLLALAAVAASSLRWWPLTRRSHHVLRCGFERWADDEATGGDRQRRVALGDALVATVTTDHAPVVGAFSLAEATAERIDAMQDPPAAPLALRLSLYLPGTIVAAVAFVAVATWVSQARVVLAMTGRCTI
jgi:hypothetical protein